MVEIPELRELRELHGLTQRELADVSGVSLRGIAGYEGGAHVRPNTARKLADALNVEVADLAGANTRPKVGTLSSRDTKAIASFNEEMLFRQAYAPNDFDAAMRRAQEVAREARKDYQYAISGRRLRLSIYDDGSTIEVRLEPISPIEEPRTSRIGRRRIGERM